MTFATTTDGNHGRGVAWAAQQLGQNAVIYMPKGSAQSALMPSCGLAPCIVTEMNYDDTVRFTMQTARQNGWEVVQDTASKVIPKSRPIMQGYATLADEAVEQMAAMGIARPTHVFLQAGVGAMAGGVLGYLVDVFGARDLHSVIVEPELADCLYRSGVKGQIVNVGGSMATIMAGPPAANPIRWAGTFCATAPPSLSPVRMP